MSERRIKDALLERYLAGALPVAQATELERVLVDSPEDRARLETLRQDSGAFLLQHPAGRMLARLGEARAQRRRRVWAWRLLVPAVALASMLLVIRLGPNPVVPGRIQLALFNADGQAVRAEQVLDAGSAVRYVLQGSSMGFVAVLRRDASGQIVVHYPPGGEVAGPYDPKNPVLGFAQLAPSAGEEEIIGLFSSTRFDIGPVVEALRTGRPLEQVLPAGTLSARVGLDTRAPAAE